MAYRCQQVLLAFAQQPPYCFPMNLGRRLKDAREKRGLTQEQLAAKVPGASQAAISALERRNSETTTLLFEFADVLQINPRWLLTGEGVSGLDGPLLGDPSDPLLHQLIGFYGDLSRDGRDKLLGTANRLYTEEHPGVSAANPFPGRRAPEEVEVKVPAKGARR